MQNTNDADTTGKNVVAIAGWKPKRRATEFVPTVSARQILDALAYIMKTNDLGVIYGGPGVGKTRTINHFRDLLEEEKAGHVWVATISPSVSTVVPMLYAIAHALDVVSAGTGARSYHLAIAKRLATAKRSILVIDESQHLVDGALEELRALHDASGAAIALVGNDGVYRRISKFAQIHSRVGVRVKLSRPLHEDVVALVESRWGKVDEDAITLLEQVAMLPGALRLVVKVMDAASGKATGNAKAVRAACKMLGVELGGGR